MNRDDLLQLREQIVSKTRQLALDNESTDPASRLELIMGLIRSGDVSKDLMQQAYEIAQQLPADSGRLEAFLDLIYEIDAQLSTDEEVIDDDEATSDGAADATY